ncbi:MAG: hypothetical protein HY294_10320 [Candidatus Rokubacteria bacterium]|nr:hypothetical protein [Candidatus Rokubacteria bacterium]MBI3826380.1 hypothetical protein [Candidatus Rokubacteria bacterium]
MLRGLSASEIAELRAGTGMGLARAAELNGYPGPRHVLDAVEAGQLQASAEQVQHVRQIFDGMKRDALRVAARIIEEEEHLEAAFRSATITEPVLRSRMAQLATLHGELRAIHLRAHLAARALLSDAQVARYDELRGYTMGQAGPHPPEPLGASHRH